MGGGTLDRIRRAPAVLKARFLRKPFGRRLAARLGHEPQPRKWIFVVGCYNSGTTLLGSILGRHPEVGTLPYEGVALSDVLPQPETFGWPRMWQRCCSEMDIPTERWSEVASRVKCQWSLSFPSRPVLLEKSIANACRMEFLEREFSPAFFIHIVRHGHAVAAGIRRKGVPARWGNHDFPDGYPLEECARQWVDSYRAVVGADIDRDRYLEVSYEDLCKDPHGIVGSILARLDLAPTSIDRLVEPQRVHGQIRPISNLNGSSIARLTEEDKVAIDRVAGELLEELGYLDRGVQGVGSTRDSTC